MNIIKLSVGDKVELKKPHPCGSKIFRVLRVGSILRVVCEGCGHDVTVDRVKFEKSIKKVLGGGEENE